MADSDAESKKKAGKVFMYTMMLGMLITGSANTLIQSY